jgi:RHS repeat-associated protein
MPDQVGSVRDVVNVSGPSVDYSQDFTPYGGVANSSGSTAPFFGFAGMVYDPNSSLNYSATRFYDPAQGRWIHRDFIEESGGLDLFSYAGGNPISNVDPSGLAEEAVVYGTTAFCADNPGCILGLALYGTYVAEGALRHALSGASAPPTWVGGSSTSVAGAPCNPDDPQCQQQDQQTKECPQRGLGGKGWRSMKDPHWSRAVRAVEQGGTMESFNGYVPTQQEALDLINEAGGTEPRIDPPHPEPNPHNYPHINYMTSGGAKGTIRIQ